MCAENMDKKDVSDSSLQRTSGAQEYNIDGYETTTGRGSSSNEEQLLLPSNTTRLPISNWQSILSVASAHQEVINNTAYAYNHLTHTPSTISAREVDEARAAPPHQLRDDWLAASRYGFQPPPPPPPTTVARPLNYDPAIHALHNTFSSEHLHYNDWPSTLLRSGYASTTMPSHMFHPISNYGIGITNALHFNQNAIQHGGPFQRDTYSTFDRFNNAQWNGPMNQAAAPSPRSDSTMTHTTSTESVQTVNDITLKTQRPRRSPIGHHVTRLTIPSDAIVLDRVNNFLRGECIEIFTVTYDELVLQVGFRCSYCKCLPRGVLAKQAHFFPSRRDTIFECVRNFKRSHVEACPCIPESTKAEYKIWVQSDDDPRKKSHQYLKAYYAEAASEIGLIDDTTKRGLAFGGPPNTTGKPSERLRLLLQASEHPDTPSSVWKTEGKDQAIQMKKFEHIASAGTRNVLLDARRNPTEFVYPQDYPTVPDFDFLLLHQLCPIRPNSSVLRKKGLTEIDVSSLSGLCCKHCARANAISGNNVLHKGVYFPTSVSAMIDSSFSQTLLNHIVNCSHVPHDIKSSLDELKGLADTHNVKTRRGIKRRFFEKIWERITSQFKK